MSSNNYKAEAIPYHKSPSITKRVKDLTQQYEAELDKDEIEDAEYKLQNCIRITLDIESYETEVYTDKRWMRVSDYVKAILASYIPRSKVEKALSKYEYDDVNDTPLDSDMKYDRNQLRKELREKLL